MNHTRMLSEIFARCLGSLTEESQRKVCAMMKDLVCGRYINQNDATPKCQQKGKSYYFCSVACREQFEKDPKKYLDQCAKKSTGTSKT